MFGIPAVTCDPTPEHRAGGFRPEGRTPSRCPTPDASAEVVQFVRQGQHGGERGPDLDLTLTAGGVGQQSDATRTTARGL